MEVTHLTDSNFKEDIKKVAAGIVLFHKKLCPHCLNMQKVLTKMSARRSEISIMYIDSEENPQAMDSLEVERVPTIAIIKDGEAVGRHIGLMNPREATAFYDSF